MNKFYVRDGQLVKYFTDVKEVVLFLEKVVKAKTNMTRPEWMQHIIDLGHGYDDSSGKIFVDSLQSQVEIGVVQQNGKHVRCNIHEATDFLKPEYGN